MRVERGEVKSSGRAYVDATLARLYSTANGSRELVAKARGVLVFPSVIQAGFWSAASTVKAHCA
jgi:lipid-binding SYLF domain-containing protein